MAVSAGASLILRVPDQNGVPRLYNMREIQHSGPEPSVCRMAVSVLC